VFRCGFPVLPSWNFFFKDAFDKANDTYTPPRLLNSSWLLMVGNPNLYELRWVYVDPQFPPPGELNCFSELLELTAAKFGGEVQVQ